MYHAVDRFLARHLGGRQQEATSTVERNTR